MANSRPASPSTSFLLKERSRKSFLARSLFIVRRSGSRMYLHKIEILEDGCVEGSFDDSLPQLSVVFDKVSGRAPVGCTGFGSKLIMLANQVLPQQEDAIQMAVFNTEDESCQISSFQGVKRGRRISFLRPPPLVISASGMIYVLAVSCRGSNPFAYFESFDPSTNKWDSLPLPTCSDPLNYACGYVVVDQHHLILVCFATFDDKNLRRVHKFYGFDVQKKQWNVIPVDAKALPPPTKHRRLFDGIVYPIYGKAEYVDGVIYAYLIRSVVTYRLTFRGDSAVLELPTLWTQARDLSASNHTDQQKPVFLNFEDASAFGISPFGFPRIRSRCLTHLGDNRFCAVETTEEKPDGSDILAVYFVTFHLDMNDERPCVCIFNSTTRFLNVRNDCYVAEIMFCFAQLAIPKKRKRFHAIDSVGSPFPDFKDYIAKRIQTLCEVFIHQPEVLMPVAVMVFSKLKHEMEDSEDLKIRFFIEYMKYRLEDGPPPDLFVLVDKELRKGLLEMERGVSEGGSSRSMYIVCSSEEPICLVCRLDIMDGVINRSRISPIHVVYEQVKDAKFGSSSFACLGQNIYIFSDVDDDVSPIWSTITNCYIVDVKREKVVEQSFDPKPAQKQMLTIIGCGSKIYALSNVLREPDSIHKVAFESFDPVSNSWETLDDAPFHSMQMNGLVCGYAVVDDNILVSLDTDSLDFYSYNVSTKKWFEVSKSKDNENTDMQYHRFHGRAEFVDNKIYNCACNVVRVFPVTRCPDGLCLHPPIILVRWNARPPIPWCGNFSWCMAHLGNKVFCVVKSGRSVFTNEYQYACVTIFVVDNSGGLQACHSTVGVLETKELDGEHFCMQGFSLN